ncbi:MED6-domain-containing protein [Phanerochaete sordida]|uniref:Mediator of RNA polymerase II transcription subunit 6 n=1 Tax=Phanerochaete sordida TaxID=48140 RepID=A0A9P3LBD9_9APHY|nr:MED6-domain-containing protein [Phanerochaete sordida]
MDLNDLHPPDDYSHRFFIWHEWIQANGPLTNENVFDYFASSMFYDKQSSNQNLRMQTAWRDPGQPLLNEAEELRRFTGIEFAVVHAQPPSLFIIQKRERLSPDEVRPLVAYFIMNNRIYQSPDVYTLVSNRLLTSLHSLTTSLDTLRQHRPAYTPRTGFIWPIKEPTTTDASRKRGLDAGDDAQASQALADTSKPANRQAPVQGGKRKQNNMLMLNAMRTTALHANKAFTLPTAVSDSAVPETPASATAGRSSATPAPSQRDGTPKPSQDNASAKGSTGGSKKRKKEKRGSIAVT